MFVNQAILKDKDFTFLFFVNVSVEFQLCETLLYYFLSLKAFKLCLVSYFYMNFTYFLKSLKLRVFDKSNNNFFFAEVLFIVRTFNVHFSARWVYEVLHAILSSSGF